MLCAETSRRMRASSQSSRRTPRPRGGSRRKGPDFSRFDPRPEPTLATLLAAAERRNTFLRRRPSVRGGDRAAL